MLNFLKTSPVFFFIFFSIHFWKLFIQIFVAKLKVGLICECSLQADVCGNYFQKIQDCFIYIYFIYTIKWKSALLELRPEVTIGLKKQSNQNLIKKYRRFSMTYFTQIHFRWKLMNIKNIKKEIWAGRQLWKYLQITIKMVF